MNRRVNPTLVRLHKLSQKSFGELGRELRTNLFILALLAVGGASVYCLSQAEFHRRAVAIYNSTPLEWNPEILWGRDNLVALSDHDDPDRPIRLLRLSDQGSGPVDAVFGILASSIVWISDSPSANLTGVCYWSGSDLWLGMWNRTGRMLPTFPRIVSLDDVRTPRLAWDEEGRRAFLLMNTANGLTVSVLQLDTRAVESFTVTSTDVPRVCVLAGGKPLYARGELYAQLGNSPEAPIYDIPISRTKSSHEAARLFEGVVRGQERIPPSMAFVDGLLASGKLVHERDMRRLFSDLWRIGEDGGFAEPLFHTDDMWGLMATPSLPGLVFAVHSSAGEGDLWLVDPVRKLARQVTTHANVSGAPFIEPGKKLSRLSYVANVGGRHMVTMLVFRSETLQKAIGQRPLWPVVPEIPDILPEHKLAVAKSKR